MSTDTPDEVSKTLRSGMITQSIKVEEFESELKKLFNHPYILTLNSATSGLTLALRLLNLQQNDEVLSCPLTCVATNFPILSNNLNIKWVDVDNKTCNINLDDLKSKITAKTKAIIFNHWGGYPVDLDKIKDIQKYATDTFNIDIKVIEDSAHAFCSEYKENKIGTYGNIAVFSTQAIKHLTTGDGGLIFLPTKELYDRAKLLRWYGISREQISGSGKDFRLEEDIKEWGYKFHMNDINATIGLCNLPYIPKNIKYNRDLAQFYRQHLGNLNNVQLMDENIQHVSSYWIYTIKVNNKVAFIEYMKNRNIMTSQVHNRNDIHSCLDKFKIELPILDELEKKIVAIPIGWWITDVDADHIVKCVRNWDLYSNCIVRELKVTDFFKYLNLLKQLNNYNTEYIYTYEKFCDKFNTIKRKGGIILVKELDGEIIATGKILIEDKFFDNIAHIEDIVVDINHRHCGFGKEIVDKLVQLVDPSDCYKIILNAKDDISDFYSKTGFKKVGNEWCYRFK